MIEKLNSKDIKLIVFCILLSAISLFITQIYFKQAFPDASIEMDITKEEAKSKAEIFLANRGHDIESYMHASRFGWLNEPKTFFEKELDSEQAGKILNETNCFYWKNRWFNPEQKEEYYVKISTTGGLAEFEHKIDEDAPGDSLTQENALNIARFFLVGTIGTNINDWDLIESKTEKLKNRWDHRFEWKEKSFNIKGSSHRLTIKVQGDKIDYYDEWIKVPDTWKREYRNIRSQNELLGNIGGVGLSITVLLIFITILVRTRKKDIHWKSAFTFAGIIAMLLVLNNLNNIPLQMYFYDTRVSLLSFFTTQILFNGIIIAILSSMFFGVLIAGSEPLYRDQYPDHISFRNTLSIQGLQSRSFFNSAIIGISLTFLTFAFQTVFYLISNKFGGWSPTEIPNFDRLGTYIPWVGVLLGGLAPAISEEAMSRMFSIPFLQKHTKSIILAVFISSIIWGLGHAGYAAQPFYIRVIEVSAMGIFISWIFIKYGILATLIWHFSVDAVYSAMILLRSSNPYFVTTGFISAGIVLLPLIYAIIAYRRNGGFISSNNLVNVMDTEIFEDKKETKETIEKAKIIVDYKPLGKKRVQVGLIIGIIGILSFIFLSKSNLSDEPIYNFTWIDKSRSEAINIAQEFLEKQGFDLVGYQSVARSENWLDTGSKNAGFLSISGLGGTPKNVEYILEFGGKDNVRDFLKNDKLGGLGWKVRFFKPDEIREYFVYMLAKRDQEDLLHFRESISDTSYYPSITKDQAQDLVFKTIENSYIDLTNMDLVKEEIIERDKRTDFHFKYEANDQHEDNVGEAKAYFNFEVYGDHIGVIGGGIKIPEAWEREFSKTTIYDNLKLFSQIILFLLLAIIGVRYLLRLIKENKPNLKLASYVGIIVFIIGCITLINSSSYLMYYNTATPINNFIFERYSYEIIGILFTALFSVFFTLTISLAWPGFFISFKKENRMIYLSDAFVSMICSIGLFSFIAVIGRLLTNYHPTFIETHIFKMITINDYYPFINIFFEEIIIETIINTLMFVSIYYIYRQLTVNQGYKNFGVLLLIIIPFLLPVNPQPLYFLNNGIWIGSLLILTRYFWRGNPWSFLFGIFGFLSTPTIIDYFFKIQDPAIRMQGFMAITITGVIILYFTKEAFVRK